MGRRTHAWLALAYGAFAVYGSLVPLKFRPLPLDEAIARFRRTPYFNLGIDNADFVANILLFIPLAYLILGMLRTDRRGRIGDGIATLGVIAFCAGLSIAIEFTQVFFPGRTLSLNDMMAETSGGIIGAVLWLAVGRSTTAWARTFSHERKRSALVEHLLLAYSIGLMVSLLLPLDLTINLGQIAQKYRAGLIIFRPFGFAHPSWLAMVWDYVADVILSVPLGAAAVVVRARPRRSPLAAMGVGVAVVALVEIAQVFVRSRYADVTDIVTGSIGVALGVAMATRLSGPDRASTVARPSPAGLRLLASGAVLVWTAVLLGYHWYPFDFSFDANRVSAGVNQLLAVPFTWYYWGTEFHAFTEASRKILLALPLGVISRFMWPDDNRAWVRRLRLAAVALGGFCLLLGVEVGQVLLPVRYPDITDPILGVLGILVGYWVMGVLRSPVRARTSPSPSPDGASLPS